MDYLIAGSDFTGAQRQYLLCALLRPEVLDFAENVMTANGWLQNRRVLSFDVGVREAAGIVHRRCGGRKNFLTPVLTGSAGLRKTSSTGLRYAGALLAFSLFSACFYVFQRMQVAAVQSAGFSGVLAMSPDLGFNTSVSFVTNTNWQSYVPETTLGASSSRWRALRCITSLRRQPAR